LYYFHVSIILTSKSTKMKRLAFLAIATAFCLQHDGGPGGSLDESVTGPGPGENTAAPETTGFESAEATGSEAGSENLAGEEVAGTEEETDSDLNDDQEEEDQD
jgi:hypothetical protein